jgi:hypothetical protein
MKKYFLFAVAVCTILFVSCKKSTTEDVLAPEVEAGADAIALSDWRAVTNWQTTRDSSSSIFSSTIGDSKINAALAENGLVLVFKKSGSTIQSLPFEEKGAGFWSYQVTEGTVQITLGTSSLRQIPVNNDSFRYLVFSEAQLEDFVKQGFPKDKLMSLSYENLVSLLHL